MKTMIAASLALALLVPTASAVYADTLSREWEYVYVEDIGYVDVDSIDLPEVPNGFDDPTIVNCDAPTTTVEALACNTLGFVEPVVLFVSDQVEIVETEANLLIGDGESAAQGGVDLANFVAGVAEDAANDAGVVVTSAANDVLVIVDGAAVVIVGAAGTYGDAVAGAAKDACTRNVPGPACGPVPGTVSHLLP